MGNVTMIRPLTLEECREIVKYSAFQEEDHPRDQHGQFAESVAESGRIAEEAVAKRRKKFSDALDSLPNDTKIKSGQNLFTKESMFDGKTNVVFWKHEGGKGKYRGHLTSWQAFIEMGSKAAIGVIGFNPEDKP